MKVAAPLASVPVPKVVVPSSNLTLPVGVPVPGAVGVTVAVNVSDCPNVEGSGVAAVKLVVVAAWLTVCVRAVAEDVLVLKFASPA